MARRKQRKIGVNIQAWNADMIDTSLGQVENCRELIATSPDLPWLRDAEIEVHEDHVTMAIRVVVGDEYCTHRMSVYRDGKIMQSITGLPALVATQKTSDG